MGLLVGGMIVCAVVVASSYVPQVLGLTGMYVKTINTSICVLCGELQIQRDFEVLGLKMEKEFTHATRLSKELESLVKSSPCEHVPSYVGSDFTYIGTQTRGIARSINGFPHGDPFLERKVVADAFAMLVKENPAEAKALFNHLCILRYGYSETNLFAAPLKDENSQEFVKLLRESRRQMEAEREKRREDKTSRPGK